MQIRWAMKFLRVNVKKKKSCEHFFVHSLSLWFISEKVVCETVCVFGIIVRPKKIYEDGKKIAEMLSRNVKTGAKLFRMTIGFQIFACGSSLTLTPARTFHSLIYRKQSMSSASIVSRTSILLEQCQCNTYS